MYSSIILLIAAHLVAGQGDTITTGPQITAAATIWGELDYTLQRSCVQHCIWYNGNLPRGYYYNDWDDVGKELKCGHAPINNCYCNTKYSTSATSYFSTCIDYYCGSGEDKDPDDLVSALSLYNAYCATANGNPTKPVPQPVTVAASTSQGASSEPSETPSPESTSAPSDAPSTTREVPNASPTSSGPATADAKTETGPSNVPAQKEEGSGSGGGGLSKGATIGIAVGASLGGVALIAIAVLSYFLHKRKVTQSEKQPMGGIEGY